MSGVESLLKNFERYVALPWEPSLAGPQKVWCAVYSPEQERRLRYQLGGFQNATLHAGHKWLHQDLTNTFPAWIADQEYRESYFESPEDMQMALDDYSKHVISAVSATLRSDAADANTLIAVYGLASLFGLMRASKLIEAVAPDVCGRLLVLFPGERSGANFRLLGARDGWNYRAIPITAQEEQYVAD
jgi:hypothetical protein